MNDHPPGPDSPKEPESGPRGGRGFDALLDRGMDLSGLIIWGLAIGIFLNIILRRFLGLGLGWLFETTEFLLLAVAFLGGAALLRDRGHVSVDLVGEVVFSRAKVTVTRVGDVLTAAILVIMAVVATMMTYRNALTGQVTAGVVVIPRWWIYAVMPVGFTLMSLQAVRALFRPPSSAGPVEPTGPAEQYPV